MIEFLTLDYPSFGFHVSGTSSRIAKIKKTKRFFGLESWGETAIRPDIISEQGEIQNKEEFIKHVKESLNNIKGKRLNNSNAIISLPEKSAFFVVIQMPKIKEEELKTAVPFEAENYIPFSAEEVYCDFQIIKPQKDHLDHFDVLVAVAPKKIVDSYINCFKKAGLNISAIEIESQAVCRSIIKSGTTSYPVLIVEFEEGFTNLIIYSGQSLRFSSSVQVSSNNLTEAISKSLNIEFGEAEKLKLKYGLQTLLDFGSAKKTTKNKEIIKCLSEAMIPSLGDLSTQIKKYVNYYKAHSEHEHLNKEREGIEKIILCGKGANLKGLSSFISLSLNIKTEVGNPWINILPEPIKEVPGLSFEESLAYTAALGLALRWIKEEKL